MNHDKRDAIEQAKQIVNNPDNYVILDTETTGLYNCEIVQIGIIDLAGNTLLDTLVKPTCIISEGSTAIHGITAADVANALTFKPVRDLIELMTRSKIVIIYNDTFDNEVLRHCCKVNHLNYLEYESICAMELYSNFVGEMHPYFNNYRWQKLPGGDHTAIGDCKATLSVIKSMAATLLEIGQLELTKEEDFIPF